MRFIYFTDSHIRGTNPKSRTDNFFETVMDKLREIQEVSLSWNADYILHGGDLFDRPDVSISVMNDIIPVLQKFTMPFYVISGNHDIYGHNPITLPRTMMGLLNTLGIIHIINDESILLEDGETTVQLSGSPYIYGLDREENRDLYLVKEKDSKADFAIHLVHGFLMTDSTKAMFSHTTISDIVDTKADLTLCGHLHDGIPITEVEGKIFANPGAMVRISNSLTELKRRPKILLIDVIKDECTIEEYELKSAKPGDEVLDRTEIEMHKFKRRELAEFKESIESTGTYDRINFLDVIVDIAENEKLDKNIKEEALKRIADVEERRSNL